MRQLGEMLEVLYVVHCIGEGEDCKIWTVYPKGKFSVTSTY